jgi:hypothetical protein
MHSVDVKLDNSCGIEGGTTLTLFRNIVNIKKAWIAVVRKVQQFPQISRHLMIVE